MKNEFRFLFRPDEYGSLNQISADLSDTIRSLVVILPFGWAHSHSKQNHVTKEEGRWKLAVSATILFLFVAVFVNLIVFIFYEKSLISFINY